ncbi:Kielin/chordin-like protein [Frankliniella fusca]|uniref:Kielin/chordin-like protein n=1 Tax=Frankliniella fusca TaxID=407009 RepID=A0AAE1LBZ4_9NEOP|nr:Kielin/chordin-like protein [Frankliniella fusca]
MSPPPATLPLLLLPPLLFAVASAGPVAPVATTLTPPPPARQAAPAAPNLEEQAVPAATLAPPADGQYCTVDGAVFHNGARLPASADPDPCRACYCQGGEPACTRVHCYRRPDCAPRHVPGSCCPKYDNCPPAPEEHSPEPRVRDAATQTDVSVEPMTTTTEAEATTTGTPTTTLVTTPEEAASETTETNTATAATDITTTTTAIISTTTTGGVTVTAVTEEQESSEESGVTSAYPPGIDLHALHEHLPFLSPGDANGPNT